MTKGFEDTRGQALLAVGCGSFFDLALLVCQLLIKHEGVGPREGVMRTHDDVFLKKDGMAES
jgi:hypothetical protein